MFRTAFAALLLLSGIAADCLAQAYPARTVRVIGAYSPGSGPDTTLRLLAERLAGMWGQQVLVENRPGANGILAMEALKKAAPDGYFLGMSDNAQMTINPHLYASLPYSSDDFAPIAMVSDAPFALLVGANSPFKNLRDLITFAKANPGKLSYASPLGVGHASHLGMEIFKLQTGVDIVFVPYKTTAPMAADVAAGTLSIGWASYASGRAFITAGSVRPLAVGARARQKVMPDVPTFLEAGGPDLTVTSWLGLFGPRGLPREIANKIAEDIAAAQRIPEVATRIVNIGFDIVTGGPDMVNDSLRADSKKHGDIIRQLKIKIE